MIITPEEAQRKLIDQADRAFRALVLEAGRRIIFRTPVDTGRARMNWHTSVGSPVLTADEYDGDDGGSVAGPATTDAVKELIHYGNLADAHNGDVVYIANGLPYIEKLENGSSTQNPQGMVKVTLAELQEVGRQVAEKIRRSQ
jgi:hypothetical protein